MTAEIAIMNKGALALAADSAVTIGGGAKTYNTVNKLFMLSKYHPVGVMIYGSAEFMGFPWETIIKLYRNKISDKERPTIEDYKNEFIEFIESSGLVDVEAQLKYFRRKISGHFANLKKDILNKVECHISVENKIVDPERIAKKIARDVIANDYKKWNSAKYLTSKTHFDNIFDNYHDVIIEIKDAIFEKLPFSKSDIDKLVKIAIYIFCKDRRSTEHSGVVVAGFGRDEIFPSLVELKIEGLFCGKLKYWSTSAHKVSQEERAYVGAFAQGEMVQTFMEGLDPRFSEAIDGYVSKIAEKLPDVLVDGIDSLDDKERKTVATSLKKVTKEVFDDFKTGIRTYSHIEHVQPIMDAVAILPKEELAIMAESLVNLTSFKRKMTLSVESVGGPIDVAVISKGDGFIWVKRKHYFNPELNHSFFSNYYNKCERY